MSTHSSGSSSGSPTPGYYADPSIPGYIRYWNGTSWVPGTSRPKPLPGEVLTPPSGAGTGRAAGSSQNPPQVPSQPKAQPQPQPSAPQPPDPRPSRTPGVDEGDGADESGTPARWSADAGRQEPNRISWGQPAQPQPAQPQPAQPQPAQPQPAQPQRPEPEPARGQGQQPVPWAQQVQQLARQDPQSQAAQPQPQPQARNRPPAPRSEPTGHVTGETFGANAMAWRPPPSNPFLQAAQTQARPSPLGRRLAARLIDSLIVGAAVGAAAAPLALAAAEHVRDKVDEARQTGENVQVWLIDGTTGLYLGLFVAAVLLAGFLYEVLPTAKWGRTLGKRLVKVKVVDIEGHDTPTLGQSLRRWLVYQVLGLLVVGVVNVMWCLFDRPWRQCWHDKSARTFVAVEVAVESAA